MRRSVFYMGKNYTQRHIMRCRSPLISGFISPIHSSFTQSALSTSAILGSTGICSSLTSASSLSAVPQELALQLQALTAQLQQAWIELCGVQSVVTFILARATYTLALSLRISKGFEVTDTYTGRNGKERVF